MFAARVARAATSGGITSRRSAAFVVATAISIAAVSGCGSSSHSAAGAGASSGTPSDTIIIRNFAFQPSTLVVGPGAMVTVHNEDPATHTVTASGGSKAFDTGNIAAGATATFTAPTTVGSYSYICLIHQFMHGNLRVR